MAETELNAAEAQLLINLIANCKVDHLAQDALLLVNLLQSSNAKLQAVIRLAQPLASAAKPKKEGDGNDILDVE